MKKFVMLLAAGVLFAGTLPASADETAALTVGAYFEAAAQSLQVSGTSTLRDSRIFLSIAPKDGAADLDSVNNQQAFVTYADVSGTAGAFAKTIVLPDSFQGGRYCLTASGSSAAAECEFSYVNQDEAADVIAAINQTPTAAGVQAAMNTAYSSFGIDAALYENQKPLIASVIAGRIPSGGYTYESFVPVLQSALAAASIAEGAAVDTVVAEYAADEVDLNAQWNKLSDKAKQRLTTLLKEADYTADPFGTVYWQNQFLAQLMEANGFADVRSAVLEHCEAAGLDIAKYNALPTDYAKDYAMQQVLDANVTAYSQIKPAFDDAVKKAGELGGGNQNDNNNQGGNGGGGNGGGSGGGSRAPIGAQTGQMTIDGSTANTLTTPPKFADLSVHWARTAVETMEAAGILSGYEDGTFRPDENVTRAEFAKMIAKVMLLSGNESAGFADVPEDAWFAPFVNQCARAGIVMGSDGMFRPNAQITRQEAAAILYRALESRNVTMTQQTTFDDQEEIADYAKEAVSYLAGLQVINGFEGRFAPGGETTRAQAATMLYNAMSQLG